VATDVLSCISVWQSTNPLVLGYKYPYAVLTGVACTIGTFSVLYKGYHLCKIHSFMQKKTGKDYVTAEVHHHRKKSMRAIQDARVEFMVCMLEDFPMLLFNTYLVFMHNARETEILISLTINSMLFGKKCQQMWDTRKIADSTSVLKNLLSRIGATSYTVDKHSGNIVPTTLKKGHPEINSEMILMETQKEASPTSQDVYAQSESLPGT
jgi:hypothetical protein